ncbi:amidohydrolase [Nocardia vinacea]|uniref:amidohydrolase n=1 Tax=Nocardia vinacea TaxID=96468 RepID=UPI00343F4AC2
MTRSLRPIPDRPSFALVNGRIFTVDEKLPWASAVLVSNKQIVAVGTNKEVLDQAPADTEVIDLGGRMVMPGIHDAHTHLLFSGLKFRYEGRLTQMAGPEQIVQDLENCCKSHDFDNLTGWVIAGEYTPMAFPDGRPDRAYLDAVFPDQPVFLWDYSIHHGLANSKALELAGITSDTPDPAGGRFIRRPGSTEVSGELVEQATWPVSRAIPDYPAEIYRDALSWAVKVCNSVGITSIQEASAGWQGLRALTELDASDELTLQVAAHIVWREETAGMASLADLERLIDERSKHSSTHVRTDFVKLWLDGAPLPPHFTESRLTDAGEPDRDNILVPPDELRTALLRFDAEGIQVKIHCAGMGSIRVALDAFEEVRRVNGPDGPAHEIAHCTYIDESDYPRFRELGVIADMSPAIWHIPELEAVLSEGYRFASLRKAGAHLTVGSDWIITPDPNLFPALQGMLQRGEQSVGLDYALRALTIEGAKAVGLADRQGSVEVGKSADLIVLDRNLFEVDVNEIGGTKVLATIFEGRPVYQVPAI